jgi:hypothetical protein
MSKPALDAATIQTYLESLPEAEVATIFGAVDLKVKRRWEFRLGVLVIVVWWMAWIWIASGFGLGWGFVGAFVGLVTAAGFAWPFARWVNNRVLKDEVALRITADGV